MRTGLISFIVGFITFMFGLFTGIIALFRGDVWEKGFFFIGISILILIVSIKFLNEDRNE